MPGWPDVLRSVATAYEQQRDKVETQGQAIIERIEGRATALEDGSLPDQDDSFRLAADAIMQNYDAREGGYGGPPKFPQPFFLGLLMQDAMAHGDERAKEQVLWTLRKMAEGGIYDQLAGGFHRYSVDAKWLVPHFEKMLYDNALLPPLYLDAARLSGDPFYARIAEETLDYVVRELRTPEGAFYASTDADSEGVEGKYFVWSLDELNAIVGADAELFATYYDVSQDGNFEGTNILHVTAPMEQAAEAVGTDTKRVSSRLAAARAKLLSVRAERVPPATDTKVIVAWNGMMIDALARGGAQLDAPRFVEAAVAAAAFQLNTLRTGAADGTLHRIYAGGRVSVTAFLDDYASLADGLLSLYEATGDERWFREARNLVEEMLARYWDDELGGFFTTGAGNERLVARNKPVYDGATPSGNSLAARAMARLYALTSDGTLAERLEALVAAHGAILAKAPTMLPLLGTTRDWLSRHQSVAIVGPDLASSQDLVDAVRGGPPRNTILMRHVSGAPSDVPQLQGKVSINDAPTAYVCHGFTCSKPVTSVAELTELLAAGLPR